MRGKLITTASVLVLMAAPVLAQTAPPSSTTRTPSSGSSMSAPPAAVKTPAPDPLKMEDVSKITGSAVYGTDDSKIGSVSTLLMKPEDKTIDRFVVSEGGVLGVGAHKVALPIDQFTWDSDKGAFKIAKTADDLKSMPEWQSQTARSQ
jgi:sporulation protein YlmC with PRC-barrel domain